MMSEMFLLKLFRFYNIKYVVLLKLGWQGPKAVRCVVFCWPSPVAGPFGVIEEEGDEDDDPPMFVGGGGGCQES